MVTQGHPFPGPQVSVYFAYHTITRQATGVPLLGRWKVVEGGARETDELVVFHEWGFKVPW